MKTSSPCIEKTDDSCIYCIDTFKGPANLLGDGKAFFDGTRVELTHAKGQNGHVKTSTDTSKEQRAGTYGLLSKTEKIEFILKQMRLTLAKNSFLCSRIVGNKVKDNRIISVDEGIESYRARCFEFMVEYHNPNPNENDAYELSKDYHAIYSTLIQMSNSGVKDGEMNNKEETKDGCDAGKEEAWMSALQATVLFLALSPHTPEQNDTLHRLSTDTNLEKNVVCHDIVLSLLNKRTKLICPQDKSKTELLDTYTSAATLSTTMTTMDDDIFVADSGSISGSGESGNNHQYSCISSGVFSGCVIERFGRRFTASILGMPDSTPVLISPGGSNIHDCKEQCIDNQEENPQLMMKGKLGDGGDEKRLRHQSLPFIPSSYYCFPSREPLAPKTSNNSDCHSTLCSNTDTSSSQYNALHQAESIPTMEEDIANQPLPYECAPPRHYDGELHTTQQNNSRCSSSSAHTATAVRSPQQSLWIENAAQYEIKGNYVYALYYYELYLTQLRESKITSDCASLEQNSKCNFKISVSHNIEMVWVLHKVGVVRWKTGEYNKSLSPLIEASSCLRYSYLNSCESDTRKVYGGGLVEVLNSIGRIYLSRGQFQQARMFFEESYGILNDVYVQSLPNDVHIGMNNYIEREIENEYSNGSCKLEPSKRFGMGVKDISGGIIMQPSMAQTIIAIGMIDDQQGKYSMAIQKFRRGYYIQRQILCPDHVDIAATLNVIGTTHGKMYKYNKAMKYHKKALKIYTHQLGKDHVDVAVTHNNIGQIYYLLGNFPKAMDTFTESIRVMKSALGESHRNVASSLHNIALIKLAYGEFDEALLIFKNVLKSQRKALGDDHMDVALTLESIGDAYEQKGRLDRSIKLYQKALRIRRSAYGSSHIYVAFTLDRIGKSLMSHGKDLKEAMRRFHEALNLYHLNGLLNEDERIVMARANLHKIRINLNLGAMSGSTPKASATNITQDM